MPEKAMTLESLLARAFGENMFGRQRGLRVEDVEAYLNAGGDVNQRTDSGQTLLHIAADNGEIDVIELLVAQGADINRHGYHGYTPLHLAVDFDCNTATRDARRATELPVTALLLRHGAKPDVFDDDGETPRDFAAAYGERELAMFDALIADQSERTTRAGLP